MVNDGEELLDIDKIRIIAQGRRKTNLLCHGIIRHIGGGIVCYINLLLSNSGDKMVWKPKTFISKLGLFYIIR